MNRSNRARRSASMATPIRASSDIIESFLRKCSTFSKSGVTEHHRVGARSFRNAYTRWLFESFYLRRPVCGRNSVLVRGAQAHPEDSEHPDGATGGTLCLFLFCHHAVQSAASGRDDGSRRWSGDRFDRPRALGLDSGNIDCTLDPSFILWG